MARLSTAMARNTFSNVSERMIWLRKELFEYVCMYVKLYLMTLAPSANTGFHGGRLTYNSFTKYN